MAAATVSKTVCGLPRVGVRPSHYPQRRSVMEYKHGTPQRYWRGCRCQPCTTANTEYARAYRKKTGRYKTIAKKRYAANRDELLSAARLRKYGVTPEKFESMILAQGNSCAICVRPFTSTPHIDHDHACCPGASSCGRCVRGLLCSNCNTGLGLLKDSPAILTAAIRYLEETIEP